MSSAWKAYGRYSTIGIELVVSMALGWAGGRWIDRHLGGHGYATAAGTLLGVYAGFRGLFKAAKLMQAEAEREDREQAERLRNPRRKKLGPVEESGTELESETPSESETESEAERTSHSEPDAD